MKRTELKALGEFGLIEKIKTYVQLQNSSTIKGIDDDAAVVDTQNQKLLISTDMLVEGIHFDLSYAPIRHLGYKAIAVNVSDIAAMNGIPTQVTVSIALSSRFSVEAVEELYEGIRLACENYKVDLVGGDTTTSKSGLIISVTVLGLAHESQIVYRNTAKANDVICVTGDLGAAYLGLQVLEREKTEFMVNPDMQPQLEDKTYLIERQLKPEARMDIIHELRDLQIVPTAMIDISDGLASEIMHICSQSKVGALIMEEQIPMANQTLETASEFGISPTTCALNGGEDYELLFTVSPTDFEKIRNHSDILPIGIIKEEIQDVRLLSKQGNYYPIKAQGWTAF